MQPNCGPVWRGRAAGRSSAAHGRSGGRAVAPSRGADLRRRGGAGGGPAKVRGAAAREPKASACGAARGKRAAPVHEVSTERRTARNAGGAPVMPLVALAMQFASLSAESGPTDMSNPCEVGARRREPRANEQGGGLGGSRGARRCAAAPCEQRAAARAGGRAGGAPPALRPRRGGNVQSRRSCGTTTRVHRKVARGKRAVTKTVRA